MTKEPQFPSGSLQDAYCVSFQGDLFLYVGISSQKELWLPTKKVHYINREAVVLIMSASLLFWKGSRYRLKYVTEVYFPTKCKR